MSNPSDKPRTMAEEQPGEISEEREFMHNEATRLVPSYRGGFMDTNPMSNDPEPFVLRRRSPLDKPIDAIALDALREADENSREWELAIAVLARGAEMWRLRKRIAELEKPS